MYKYQKAADNTADEVAKTYIKAANYINSEAETIFKTFQTKHKLTEKEAYDLINEIKDKDTLNSLKAVAEKITDPEKKKEILKIIEAPAYRFRIARLEALQRNIDSYVNELCQNEIDVTKAHYVELSEKAYNYTTYDIQKNIGVMFPFDRIGRERISEILAYNWSGKLFSERIWGRGNEVNQKLKTEILTGFLTGRNYETTAKEIEKQMSAGAMEARRLVRTESTYVANISEIESYKECGVEKFRFVAVLDMKTSELCAEKDGMEFDVENARTGTNVPPLHPWCRSTTAAVIDELKRNRLKRSALDPKTGKYYTVPSDMTYGEWKKSIDERYGKGYYDKKRKMLENRNADKLQLEKYRDVLGGKNLPKSLDKFQELKYNKTDEWKEIKRQYRYEKNPYLQARLDCVMPNGEKLFIPSYSAITNRKAIAGNGTNIMLKVEDRLIEKYGGATGQWKKCVGKIESEKHIFDVHWYELDRKQYDTKLKHGGDKI